MHFFHIELKMNVPNALSILRIVLLPVFVVLYIQSKTNEALVYWAFGVLVLSGVTDSLDGIIARRFNQITDLGKLLDPVADKLTQVTVVACLAIRYTAVVYLLAICLIKELFQSIGGFILLRAGEKIHGARWYGKVSTFVFYGFMALLVAWPGMPTPLLMGSVSLVAVLMLFAFFKYMTVFFHLKKTIPGREEASANDSKSA